MLFLRFEIFIFIPTCTSPGTSPLARGRRRPRSTRRPTPAHIGIGKSDFHTNVHVAHRSSYCRTFSQQWYEREVFFRLGGRCYTRAAPRQRLAFAPGVQGRQGPVSNVRLFYTMKNFTTKCYFFLQLKYLIFKVGHSRRLPPPGPPPFHSRK